MQIKLLKSFVALLILNSNFVAHAMKQGEPATQAASPACEPQAESQMPKKFQATRQQYDAALQLVGQILGLLRGTEGAVSEDALKDLVFTPLRVDSPILKTAMTTTKSAAQFGYDLLASTKQVKSTIANLDPPPNILKPSLIDHGRAALARLPVINRYVSDPLKAFVAQYARAGDVVDAAEGSIQSLVAEVQETTDALMEYQETLSSEATRFDGVSNILGLSAQIFQRKSVAGNPPRDSERPVIEESIAKIVIPYLLETKKKALLKASSARKGLASNVQVITTNNHAIKAAENTLELSIPFLRINLTHLCALAKQDALTSASESIDEAATRSFAIVTQTLAERSERLHHRLEQGPIAKEVLDAGTALQEETLKKELAFQEARPANLAADIQALEKLRNSENAQIEPLQLNLEVLEGLRKGETPQIREQVGEAIPVEVEVLPLPTTN